MPKPTSLSSNSIIKKKKDNKDISKDKIPMANNSLDKTKWRSSNEESKIRIIRENTSTSSSLSDMAMCAVSEVFTVPQEHGRLKAKVYSSVMVSPNHSLFDVTTSMSMTSITASITRFRVDFDEFKCKMKIFGESLNLCKCIASDFKNKMKWMEKRLDNLEKRHTLTRRESNYSTIIQKNKTLSQKCLNVARKLQMCGTEDEMREVAAQICKNYLHGAWKTIDPSDIFFQRISGGLSNFLYLVGLPDDPSKLPTFHVRESSPEEDDSSRSELRVPSFTLEEPHRVLLRIYGQVHGERAMDAIVSESVIFTLLSERKLGPRLHGVFSGGRIEEYLPARALFTKELADPANSMKIAEMVAAIHTMALPLSKDPDWLWKNSYKWVKTFKAEQTSGNIKGQNPEQDRIIQMMCTVDFDKELKWLKKYLATIDSPVVFCHNDLQEGNILLYEDNGGGHHDDTFEGTVSTNRHKDIVFDDANTTDSLLSRMSDSGEPRMVFIDYEYCAYNYRGFDIANHFQEWALDYSNPDYPFYFFNEEDFPTLEQKEIFIKEYLKHFNAHLSDGKDTNPPTVHEINKLLHEVEAFSLSSNLLWTLWSCVNAPKSQIPFGYWEYSQTRLDLYYKLKQEIIKKGNVGAQKRKICEVDI